MKKVKKQKNRLRFKKAVVFAMTVLFMFGLVAVDGAYSEMMGKEGVLSLQTRRVDHDNVRFSLLGQQAEINVTDMRMTLDDIKDEAVDFLEDVSANVRKLLGIPAWPRDDLPFEYRIL